MAANPRYPGDSFEAENTGGALSGFLAEEDDFDRRSLWRLGSWGFGTVAAVVIAVMANQTAFRSRLDQVAADDLARQAQQLRMVAKESQNEARRLASAVDTLNSDRDRLYSRVAVLEQGLDSVTGSIARQNAAAAPTQAEPQAAATAPPAVAPVATTAAVTVAATEPAASNPPAATPATPLIPAQSIMAPPDAAAAKLVEPGIAANSAAPEPEVVASIPAAEPELKLSVQRTEFAVDVGTANSLGGLRALWRGLLKSNAALAALRPVVAIKEANNGLGMQLRLVVGPIGDAAAAAKICAGLAEEGQKTCETTVFDGQRLAMRADEQPASIVKPVPRKRTPQKSAASAEPKKPEVSTISSLFGRR
jgi:hypothetical protein